MTRGSHRRSISSRDLPRSWFDSIHPRWLSPVVSKRNDGKVHAFRCLCPPVVMDKLLEPSFTGLYLQWRLVRLRDYSPILSGFVWGQESTGNENGSRAIARQNKKGVASTGNQLLKRNGAHANSSCSRIMLRPSLVLPLGTYVDYFGKWVVAMRREKTSK